MSSEIGSLEEYRMQEEELKSLLSSMGSLGDLADGNTAIPDAKEIIGKVSAIKNRLSAYRSAHPEEFNN